MHTRNLFSNGLSSENFNNALSERKCSNVLMIFNSIIFHRKEAYAIYIFWNRTVFCEAHTISKKWLTPILLFFLFKKRCLLLLRYWNILDRLSQKMIRSEPRCYSHHLIMKHWNQTSFNKPRSTNQNLLDEGETTL